MHWVPGNILDDGGVPSEDSFRIDIIVSCWRGIDVPHAHGAVVAGRQQVAFAGRIPRQAVALLLVTAETQLWLAHVSLVLRCKLPKHYTSHS